MVHFLIDITTFLSGFCLFDCDFGIFAFTNFTLRNVLKTEINVLITLFLTFDYIMIGKLTLLSLKFDRKRKTLKKTMGKSQFALLLLYSFTLKAKAGFALRCYGCTDASWVSSQHDTIANDATECSSDFGKVFNCSGLCVKVFSSGISELCSKSNKLAF